MTQTKQGPENSITENVKRRGTPFSFTPKGRLQCTKALLVLPKYFVIALHCFERNGKTTDFKTVSLSLREGICSLSAASYRRLVFKIIDLTAVPLSSSHSVAISAPSFSHRPSALQCTTDISVIKLPFCEFLTSAYLILIRSAVGDQALDPFCLEDDQGGERTGKIGAPVVRCQKSEALPINEKVIIGLSFYFAPRAIRERDVLM